MHSHNMYHMLFQVYALMSLVIVLTTTFTITYDVVVTHYASALVHRSTKSLPFPRVVLGTLNVHDLRTLRDQRDQRDIQDLQDYRHDFRKDWKEIHGHGQHTQSNHDRLSCTGLAYRLIPIAWPHLNCITGRGVRNRGVSRVYRPKIDHRITQNRHAGRVMAQGEYGT